MNNTLCLMSKLMQIRKIHVGDKITKIITAWFNSEYCDNNLFYNNDNHKVSKKAICIVLKD